MQRRTNLFYTQGDDSKFITFSNYTESLTGNFLATDWKMFPSKFICLNIPELTNDNKAEFIHYLVKRYENKLAFVRDWCIANNKKIDDNTLPLAWLFEAINDYFEDVEITYVSEIVEQNYNGVYADTICTIEGTQYPKSYSFVEKTADKYLYYVDKNEDPYSQDYLYGWYKVTGEDIEYTGISNYENDKPEFDGTNDTGAYYLLDSRLKEITVGETVKKDIVFNVIIPLFDLTNMNTTTNVNTIDESIDLTSQIGSNSEDKINIPFGVWFAEQTITLNRDNLTGYAPAWSLVLSSQFKPFPYSDKLSDDNYDKVYAEQAYVTFAEILSRQNNIIKDFTKMTAQIADLSNRIEAIETKLNNIGTTANIDALHKEMILFENHINNIIDMAGLNNNESLTWSSKFNG